MRSLGKIWLDVCLCGRIVKHCFTIVQGLFPKVIIGIKQMKKDGIVVDPQNDCIWFENQRVPFVSKVETIVESESQGKGRQLVLRA